MNLPLFIAGRYLFAKKSHNVINIISAISAIGMAVGTAVLIIILSVYNGFDELIENSLNEMAPDFLVVPASGKVFVPSEGCVGELDALENVVSVSPILQESVFLNYDGHQGIGIVRGVVDSSLMHGDVVLCAVASALSYDMGINPNFVAPLEMFFPDRNAGVSMTDPTANLRSVKARPTRLISMNSSEDNTLVMVPLDSMRELLDYDEEVSALEIRVEEGCTRKEIRRVLNGVKMLLGEGFIVKDRYMQNESLYKMMRYEKASIYLILIFIIIIIAFNIFGSLTMLIIDKKGDIAIFRSMGATDLVIRRIFILEGWLISLLGLSAGLIVGLLLAFLQQKFGLISLPGNYIVSSYPVRIQFSDIVATMAGVALTGYLIAVLPARRTVSRS